MSTWQNYPLIFPSFILCWVDSIQNTTTATAVSYLPTTYSVVGRGLAWNHRACRPKPLRVRSNTDKPQRQHYYCCEAVSLLYAVSFTVHLASRLFSGAHSTPFNNMFIFIFIFIFVVEGDTPFFPAVLYRAKCCKVVS